MALALHHAAMPVPTPAQLPVASGRVEAARWPSAGEIASLLRTWSFVGGRQGAGMVRKRCRCGSLAGQRDHTVRFRRIELASDAGVH
jgi:hypothetical protein